MLIFCCVSEATLTGAQSQHLNGNYKSVNNREVHSFPPTFLCPLSSDLLTERQVGVGVQVTGASIVTISVTQLAARCYSAICATAEWNNNGFKSRKLRFFFFFLQLHFHKEQKWLVVLVSYIYAWIHISRILRLAFIKISKCQGMNWVLIKSLPSASYNISINKRRVEAQQSTRGADGWWR